VRLLVLSGGGSVNDRCAGFLELLGKIMDNTFVILKWVKVGAAAADGAWITESDSGRGRGAARENKTSTNESCRQCDLN
jgi:hypothetical protein